MAGLIKFKSFREARENDFERMYGNNLSRMVRFSLPGKILYKPGLYKYKTFEDARRDDLERLIKNDHA